MSAEETFESVDAGASETFPMEAGQIKKGGYICIKGRPCKVVSVSTSKTGKHGHAKAHFVAIDIFTGKKMEDIVPSTHGTTVPNVFKEEYSLLDISDEDYLSLMDANGEVREDIRMPTYPDELVKQIRDGFDAGDTLSVWVVKALGEEHVLTCKKHLD
ncbi:MAG: hypothetical protein Ct9H90mP28_2850 [Paracoccaceae bacterium]|nr:MAG: hypothetical protein Ct9H90mP28_2850 [Paracoccaceae bacterium]